MLICAITAPDGTTARRAFTKFELTIGSEDRNDIVIAHANVEDRHARIVVKDGKVIVVDLKSASGTRVNGKRMTAPLVVRASDRIGIADHELVFESFVTAPIANDYAVADDVEDRLLESVIAGDAASREVYADWLEASGDAARAEFLRTSDGDERRLQLAPATDVAWRALVTRPAIERCTFEFECPKRWSELAPTAHDGVRHCGSCNKAVHYCVTVAEAKAHARRGACVALDLTANRWRGDVEPQPSDLCDACEADIGPGHQRCPQCGGNPRAPVMMMGRVSIEPRE